MRITELRAYKAKGREKVSASVTLWKQFSLKRSGSIDKILKVDRFDRLRILYDTWLLETILRITF